MKRPNESAPATALESSLSLLRKSNAELYESTVKLAAKNDQLARSLGWDVPEEPKPAKWSAR